MKASTRKARGGSAAEVVVVWLNLLTRGWQKAQGNTQALYGQALPSRILAGPKKPMEERTAAAPLLNHGGTLFSPERGVAHELAREGEPLAAVLPREEFAAHRGSGRRRPL